MVFLLGKAYTRHECLHSASSRSSLAPRLLRGACASSQRASTRCRPPPSSLLPCSLRRPERSALNGGVTGGGLSGGGDGAGGGRRSSQLPSSPSPSSLPLSSLDLPAPVLLVLAGLRRRCAPRSARRSRAAAAAAAAPAAPRRPAAPLPPLAQRPQRRIRSSDYGCRRRWVVVENLFRSLASSPGGGGSIYLSIYSKI